MRTILKVMVVLIVSSMLVPAVVIADTNQDKLKEMLETYNESIKEHEAIKEKVKEENKEEDKGEIEEPVTAVNFSDVHSYHWFKDDVRDLVSRGSISGFPDGTFRPFDKVTRAEFLKMVLLSVDKTIQGVPTIDHWASGILNSAYDLGIVLKSEISQTNVDLNTNITRSEMARILVRVNEIIQNEPPVSTNGIENIMYDYYHVEHRFKSYVEQAYMKGLVAGSGNRSIFNGRNTGSRAEASAMIIRLLDNSKRVKVDFNKKWYPDYNGALVNEKGQMAEMKAKEFVFKSFDTVKIYSENGKYYISVNLADLPEGFYWQPGISVYIGNGFYLYASSDRETKGLTGNVVFELEGVTKSHIKDDAWLIFSLQIVSDKNIHGSIRFQLNTTGPGMASENDGSLGDERYFPYDTTKQFEGWK